MPTPFYHLSIAEQLLEQPDLQPEAKDRLSQERGIFLFGNTAPDVQSISGQPREDTHFFNLPIQINRRPPWETLLLKYPGLQALSGSPPAQTAFIAGYLCHLQADWFWIKDIYAPVFGPTRAWASFSRRLTLHNVLRAYLDQQILPALSPGMGESLGRVSPPAALPFASHAYLIEWRDFLAGQLQPGAASRTVEVFAGRQGIDPQDFYALLASEDQMEQRIFRHLPLQALDRYRQELVRENVRLLNHYFSSMHLPAMRRPAHHRPSIFGSRKA